MKVKADFSWFVPVLILRFLLKQTKSLVRSGYSKGHPWVVKTSRKIWDMNPIIIAEAIPKFKNPTNVKGTSQKIE
jgi:hypothetical protein